MQATLRLVRQELSSFCALLMFWAALSAAAHPAQAAGQASAPKPNIRAQVVEFATGSVIEVRMLDKRKLRGRLGEMDNEGFDLQFNQGNQIAKQRVLFADIKSVKGVDKGMSTGAKVALGALAGVGVFFLILIAVCFSGNCSS